MALRRVRIDKQDNCLTYALKRAGITSDIPALIEVDKYFRRIPYAAVVHPNIGDIVMWDSRAKTVKAGWEIDEQGAIAQFHVVINLHVGVVESGGRVSDVTRKIVENLVPTIRMRKLTEMRRPDWILIPKELCKAE